MCVPDTGQGDSFLLAGILLPAQGVQVLDQVEEVTMASRTCLRCCRRLGSTHWKVPYLLGIYCYKRAKELCDELNREKGKNFVPQRHHSS